MVFFNTLEKTAFKREPTTYTSAPTSALVTSATPTALATTHWVLAPNASNASSIPEKRFKSFPTAGASPMLVAAGVVSAAPTASSSGLLPLLLLLQRTCCRKITA